MLLGSGSTVTPTDDHSLYLMLQTMGTLHLTASDSLLWHDLLGDDNIADMSWSCYHVGGLDTKLSADHLPLRPACGGKGCQ